MTRVTLNRQVTSGASLVLAPGPHELPDDEAAAYVAAGWAEPVPVGVVATTPTPSTAATRPAPAAPVSAPRGRRKP